MPFRDCLSWTLESLPEALNAIKKSNPDAWIFCPDLILPKSLN